MFEYVCDKLVPGCHYKARAETEEEAHELARDHLHEHHQLEYIDDQAWETIGKAVMPIIH